MKRKYWILICVTTLVVVLDQWTKAIVVNRFHLGETISVMSGFFSLTYIRNPGAAFGFLAQADPAFRIPFFLVVPGIALFAIGYVFRKIQPRDLKLSTALSLVIGGAIGNLIDRVMLGAVIDFLDFYWRRGYHFPAFNVADSAICIGVGILMIDLLLNDPDLADQTDQKESKKHASSTS